MPDTEKISTKQISDKELYQHLKNDKLNPALQDIERKRMQESYLTWYKLYKGIVPHEDKDTPWEGCSNLFIPETMAVVDGVVASILEALFTSNPLVVCTAYPDLGEEIAEKARSLEIFFNWLITEEIRDYYSFWKAFIQNGCIYGTSFAKVGWEILTRHVGVRDMDNNIVWKRRVYKDSPSLYVVENENLFYPSHITDIQSSPFIAERLWRSLGYLKNREKEGYFRNTKELDTEIREISRLEALKQNQEGTESQDITGLPIIEYWGEADINDDGFDEYCHIIYTENQEKILRREEAPYFHGLKPYISWRYSTIGNRFHGIGIPEIVKSCQEELNTLHNQRVDNVDLQIAGAFKYVDDGFVGREKTKIRPGELVKVGSIDNLVPIFSGGNINYANYREEEMILAYIERATGYTAFQRGQLPQSAQRAAATTVLSVMGEGAKNLNEKLKSLREPMEMVLDMLKWLYYQYGDPKKLNSIPGLRDVGHMIPLEPHDFTKEFKFNLQGTNTSMTPEMRYQNMLSLYTVLTNNPLIMGNPTASYYLTRELLRAAPFISNIDSILPREVLDQMAQQAKAQPEPKTPEPGADAVRQVMGNVMGSAGGPMGGLSSGNQQMEQPPSIPGMGSPGRSAQGATGI
jgi:hypothetical protein